MTSAAKTIAKNWKIRFWSAGDPVWVGIVEAVDGLQAVNLGAERFSQEHAGIAVDKIEASVFALPLMRKRTKK